MKRKTTKPTPDACPKCGGAGYVLTDDGAVACECLADFKAARALAAARIPKKFLGKTLSGFTHKSSERAKERLVEDAKRFVQAFRPNIPNQPGRGLLLVGKEGTGKTHVAVAILRDIIAKGFTGLYWNVPELFLELRRIIQGNEPVTEADLFDQAQQVDLLVLDDLGAEKTSDYVLDRLYVLINRRYENDAAMIITTNSSVDELRRQLGPRIASRLCEMCVVMEFPEGDFRRQNMK